MSESEDLDKEDSGMPLSDYSSVSVGRGQLSMGRKIRCGATIGHGGRHIGYTHDQEVGGIWDEGHSKLETATWKILTCGLFTLGE